MRAFTLLSFLLLSGCMVGPDYHEPVVNVPDKWGNLTEKNQKGSQIWEEIYWWENYKDPTLTYLIRETLRGNYDLKVAFSKICQSRALLSGAEATIAPEIDGTGSFTRNQISLNQGIFSSSQGAFSLGKSITPYYNLYGLGFTTSWEIDLFGRLRRGIEAADATVDVQIEDMHGVLLSLIAEVATNYINLRSYQEQLKVAQKIVESWDSVFKLNKDLKVGFTSDIDVSQVKAFRDQAEASLFPLKASIKTTIHQLSILIGKSPLCLYGLLSKPKPIPQIPSEIFAGLPSELLKRRPDIREAERNIAVATAQIGVAEGSLYPTFSLTGTAGYQSSLTSNLFTTLSRYFTVGPGFSWPIIDFGRVRAAINAAIATRDQNFYQYKSTLLNALADVENSLVNYDAEAKRYHDLKKAYEANQYAVEANLSRFKGGLINFITVLQAEIAYQTSALAMVQSQTTLALNSVALYKSLGGGWQVDKTQWSSAP